MQDGVWRYDIMDSKDKPATVTLEGGTLREDPLQGLFEVDLKLDISEMYVEAVTLHNKCFIKRA